MPFDAPRQWERVDRETSKQWLNSFAEMFTIHVKVHIDRLAGEKTIELAKQPKAAPELKAGVVHTDVSAHTNPGQDASAKLNINLRIPKTKKHRAKPEYTVRVQET